MLLASEQVDTHGSRQNRTFGRDDRADTCTDSPVSVRHNRDTMNTAGTPRSDHCAGEVALSEPSTFRAAATESFAARCRRVQRLHLCFGEMSYSLTWAEVFVAWMIAINEPALEILERHPRVDPCAQCGATYFDGEDLVAVGTWP